MADCERKQIKQEQIKAALSNQYPVSKECEIQLLKYSENLTYLIEDGQKRYVLRLYRPGYHKKEEQIGELLWIKQLKQDTQLKTADVIPGRDGELIQKIAVQDTGDQLDGALFEFLPGKNLSGMTGESLYHYMKEIGKITALLHNHAISWEKSGSIGRFTWNFEDLVGAKARWGDYSEMNALTPFQKKAYDNAVWMIKRRLERYGKGKDRYGLIHSDLNINNILVDGEELYVLDFDDCGYGWFLYDLATSVLEYFDEVQERCMKALLEGYGQYRKLSEKDLEELETFLVLRKIVRVGWIATHADNDTVKKVDPDYYEKTAQMAARYYEKNRQ